MMTVTENVGCHASGTTFYVVEKSGEIYQPKFINKDGTTTDPRGPSFSWSKKSDLIGCKAGPDPAGNYCQSYRWNHHDFFEHATWTGRETNDTEISRAQAVMYQFLWALHDRSYGLVAYYYGGTYDDLQKQHPKVAPKNKAALLEQFCETEGDCAFWDDDLIIGDESPGGTGRFTFTLGKLKFHVQEIDREYKVLDLPPRRLLGAK